MPVALVPLVVAPGRLGLGRGYAVDCCENLSCISTEREPGFRAVGIGCAQTSQSLQNRIRDPRRGSTTQFEMAKTGKFLT